jgi:hypothetical protein
LETNPVTIGNVRDQHADGDEAFLRIDGGIDVNGNGSIEHVTPGTIAYGFEDFSDVHEPGYFAVDGQGVYEQSVDATQLSEGVHFITSRAYRHRNPDTGGDGGPPVYTDFRQAVYVDRLPPESEVFSFEPYESQPNVLNQRDLVVRSIDETADSVHVFLNLPASLTDQQVLSLVSGGNQAGHYDRDLFIYGFNAVRSGNNVVTIVSYEPTGNNSVIRVPATELQSMLNMQTGSGLGLGDLNFDNTFQLNDLLAGGGGFETVLYGQNSQFNPGADANADGLIDTRDMFLLGGYLLDGGASQSVLDAYCGIVLRRGDVNQDGMTDATDLSEMYANFGSSDWFTDLNVDGTTDDADVTLLIESIFGTLAGDANLDGTVDGADFLIWNANKFDTNSNWLTGDFNGDNITDGADFLIWNTNKFQDGPGCTIESAALHNVPEPAGLVLLMAGIVAVLRAKRRSA